MADKKQPEQKYIDLERDAFPICRDLAQRCPKDGADSGKQARAPEETAVRAEKTAVKTVKKAEKKIKKKVAQKFRAEKKKFYLRHGLAIGSGQNLVGRDFFGPGGRPGRSSGERARLLSAPIRVAG